MSFSRFFEAIEHPILDMVSIVFSYISGETFFIIAFCLIYWCIHKDFAYKIGFTYITSSLLLQGLKISLRTTAHSDHIQNATALFSAVALNFSKKTLKAFCFFIILLSGLSRIYLGADTPLNVITSFIITLLIALAVNYFMDNYRIDNSHTKIIILVIVMLILLLSSYGCFLYSLERLEGECFKNSLKPAGISIGFITGWIIEKKYINFNMKTYGIIRQISKYILGVVITLLLKEGLRLATSSIPFTFLPGEFLRYFLPAIWITCIYPLIIKKVFKAPFNTF